MSAVLASVDAPTLCECGCGEPTNLKYWEARLYRREGLTYKAIAAKLDLTPASVKMYLRNVPPKWIKGHWRAAWQLKVCEGCGRSWKTPGRSDYCGRSPECREGWWEHKRGVWWAEMHRPRDEERRRISEQARRISRARRELARDWERNEVVEALRHRMTVEFRAEGYGLLAGAYSLDAPAGSGDATFADLLAARPADPAEWLEQTTAGRLMTIPREHPLYGLVQRIAAGEHAPTAEESDALREAYGQAQNLVLGGRSARARVEPVTPNAQGLDQKRRVLKGGKPHGTNRTKRGRARAGRPSAGGITRDGHAKEQAIREARLRKPQSLIPIP